MNLQEDWFATYREARGTRAERYRTCTTVGHNAMLMEQYPAFRRLLSDLEHETSARLSEPGATAADDPVTIPVIVHVVWSTDEQNIAEDQIASQIDRLNADYAATNPDKATIPDCWKGMPIDSGIRFRLADRDPQGEVHTGIERIRSEVAEFSTNDGVKKAATGGADAWPADRYLNLWVCNLGGGILGYAQFPGGPPETDGVVIGYHCFGAGGTAAPPYDLGRTATHEVGHWLNLRHIWGDTEDCTGSDLVADTPTQRLPNYNVPTYPSVSCGNAPNGDMFMNYMDYVDDIAMVMFTPGQVARMKATLGSIRAALATSNGFA